MTTKTRTPLAAQREQYLTRATKLIAAAWLKMGVTVPTDVALSCGFPGGGSPRRRIGECWPRSRRGKKVNQVFISPVLERTGQVLDVLGHELLHAVDDCASGHGVAFTRLSQQVGYTGGKHSAATGPAIEVLAKIAKKLGAYPHGAVVLTEKKQKSSSGLHKFACTECDDVLYSTEKKVDAYGVPKCRGCGEEMQLFDRENKKVVTTV